MYTKVEIHRAAVSRRGNTLLYLSLMLLAAMGGTSAFGEAGIDLERAQEELLPGKWKPNIPESVALFEKHKKGLEEKFGRDPSLEDFTKPSEEETKELAKSRIYFTKEKVTIRGDEHKYTLKKGTNVSLRELALSTIPGTLVREHGQQRALKRLGDDYGRPFGATSGNHFLISIRRGEETVTDEIIFIDADRIVQIHDGYGYAIVLDKVSEKSKNKVSD